MKRLALSVAYFQGRGFTYEAELEAWNSFALPGTPIYLQHDGSSNTQIHLLQGTKELRSRAFKAVVLRNRSQDVYLARPEQALQPPWTHERLLSFEAVVDDWPSALGKAVRILQIVPDAYRLVREFGPMVVPIQNEDRSVMSSVSFDSHPSAVFTSWCDRVEMLAETLVHESDHQRFYLASRLKPVWPDDEGLKPSLYRSPWRDDPRPLDGILRGACAFDSVSTFWVSVLESGGVVKDVDQQRWVIERAVYTNYQAIDAIRTILEFGTELSEAGRSLVSEVVQNLKATKDRLLAFSDTPRCAKRAEELQGAHDGAWMRQNRASGLLSTSLNYNIYMSF
jgi:HEXXH motif-containing protein